MDYNCLYKVPNPQCIHISFLLTYHYSLIWNKFYLFNVFILLDLPPKVTVLSSGEFCLHCDFCLLPTNSISSPRKTCQTPGQFRCLSHLPCTLHLLDICLTASLSIYFFHKPVSFLRPGSILSIYSPIQHLPHRICSESQLNK